MNNPTSNHTNGISKNERKVTTQKTSQGIDLLQDKGYHQHMDRAPARQLAQGERNECHSNQ